MTRCTTIILGTVAALLFGLSPEVAKAQSEVKGSGYFKIYNGAPDTQNQFRHISVNAWVDEDGFAQGWMTWQGDVTQALPAMGPVELVGGPSVPFFIVVTDIVFDGNSAHVTGIVVSSPTRLDEGSLVGFSFTDNSSTGDPDEIDGQPIEAGRITLR
jgi:hypothetical protein